MTDVLRASETTLLPPLPQGWHAVAFAALADGALAILGSTFDVRGMLIAWRDSIGDDDGPQVEVENPFKDGTGVPARIWTFDGARLVEGPAFPLLTPDPRFDRFPDGRWLVAVSRSAEEPLSRIIGTDGTEVRRLQFGDGVGHVQVDDVGHVWVGWFDEGVFGNQGFFGDRMTWSYPGLSEPPSRFGLAAFDEQGSLVAHAPHGVGIKGIADCYALNVAGHTAWACPYQGFPILSVAAGQPSCRWTTKLSGPKAIAVQPPYVLTAGGYEPSVVGTGPGSDHVTLIRLDGERGQTVAEWRLPFKTHDWREVELVSGRGDTLHVVRGGVWHRWRIGDAMARNS